MIVIDTNVLVAYFSKNDTLHDKAVRLAEKISSGTYGPAVISDYVFDEAVTVLSARVGRKQAILFGNELLSTFDVLRVTEPLFRATWWLFKASIGLSFTDCSNIAVAQELSAGIATFDKEYRKVKVNVIE